MKSLTILLLPLFFASAARAQIQVPVGRGVVRLEATQQKKDTDTEVAATFPVVASAKSAGSTPVTALLKVTVYTTVPSPAVDPGGLVRLIDTTNGAT